MRVSMVAKLMKWLEEQKRRRERAKYHRGYEFAAGHLLAGGTIEELRNMQDVCSAFGDYSFFDEGVDSAICDHLRLIHLGED
jgi:hypothetical protein